MVLLSAWAQPQEPPHRPVGLYGRAPALIPAGLRDLTWYVAGALPKAPPSVAIPAVADWGMLGNDTLGDCGFAGMSHGAMSVAADLSLTLDPRIAEAAAVSQAYLAYNKGQDQGVVLSKFLADVRANPNGYFGYKLHSYAPVSVSDVPTLQWAIDAYDYAYTGIAVTAGMEQAFAQHKPWDLTVLESQVVGGHCIPLVGYDSNYLYAITWGGIQAITYSAWHYIAQEAWAVFPEAMVTASRGGHGVALDIISGDLDKLRK